MKKHNYLIILLLLCATLARATHNLSGEIIFNKTGGLSVTATIRTFTKASSVNADRDSLVICWGDGTCETIARYNGNGDGELLGQDIKKNLYTGSHTYLTEGIYLISMTDNNRSGNILNVNPPASDNVPFHLEAMLRLLPDAAGSNYSPRFLEDPIDVAYAFQPFIHVPNGYDPDGDSLVYELVIPMQGIGENVPNYLFPDQIAPGDDNKIAFNTTTGAFYWDSPIISGHYCIAIVVKAYRNGILVESTRRDLSIVVGNQNNYAPAIALNPDIQPDEVVDVTVGQTLQIAMSASDPDAGQTLTLTASGEPFEAFLQEKAQFTATTTTGVFTWNIKAEQVRTQPYPVLFKAKDDLFGAGLASMRVVRIRVRVVSGSTDVQAEPLGIVPNPATDETLIRWLEPMTEPAVLQLFDFQGKLLQSEMIPAGANNIVIDLGGFPAGLYGIDIQTERGKRLEGKVLKI